MNDATLADLLQRWLDFRRERDWEQFHNLKDMGLGLSLEVHELLELMQWKQGDELAEHLRANAEAVGDELADVLGWVLLIAADLGIDLAAAYDRKMIKNARKYPVDKSKGRATKYTDL